MPRCSLGWRRWLEGTPPSLSGPSEKSGGREAVQQGSQYNVFKRKAKGSEQSPAKNVQTEGWNYPSPAGSCHQAEKNLPPVPQARTERKRFWGRPSARPGAKLRSGREVKVSPSRCTRDPRRHRSPSCRCMRRRLDYISAGGGG